MMELTVRRGLIPLALLVLALPPAAAAAPGGSGEGGDVPAGAAVAAAIERARDEGSGYQLLAHCTDEAGFRSLEVFRGEVAIWNSRTQVGLGAEARKALLDILLRGGFPALDESYGGQRPPELPKPAVEPSDGAPSREESSEAAAARVTCRVRFDADGVGKTSIQQAQGEQSAALADLAGALLDRVEPLAAEHGVGADDLADGLAKLAAGKLAPETFGVRFVRLPEGPDAGTGAIVRVEGLTLSRRPYAPGRELGEPTAEELDRDHLVALIGELREADLASLPANLWAADRLELEVRVLDHRQTVIARPFRGLSPKDKGEAQQRFDALAAYLRAELLAAPAAEEAPDTDSPGAR